MALDKAIVGWPRWTAKATFSGGSWVAAYPLSNLGALPLARVARSTNLLATSTTFTITLDRQRNVRVLALVRHNLTVTATLRVRIWSDTAQTTLTYDSGINQAWLPVFSTGSLDWEDDQWWSGTYSQDALPGNFWTLPILLDGLKLATKIQVDIVDSANTAGYIEIGMCEVAQGWELSVNPEFGAEEGYRIRTQEQEALGGVKYYERRDKPRVWRGNVAMMPRDEALIQGLELTKQADIDLPFLWVPYPGDTPYLIRTAFLARNTNPGLIAYAAADRSTVPLAFEEVL